MNEPVKSNMKGRLQALSENLTKAFAGAGCEIVERLGEVTLLVPREQLLSVAAELRDGEDFRFEELIDLCGLDYSDYGKSEWATGTASFTGFGRGVESSPGGERSDSQRFAVVYHLLSVSLNQRLRVRVFVDGESPLVDSVTGIWKVADWFEREAFDLLGILFVGHQDLRRILTDYGFVGHPFRKDFPLHGQVELRYDMEKKRVVYEPVSIEPRTLVPKVIREDNRYLDETNRKQGPADA